MNRVFCQNCGAQMSGAFCNLCGAKASQAPAAPPPPPQYAQPQQYAQPTLAPAAKGGSGLKILFVVLGIIVLLGALGVGAAMYAWHKAKETIASTTGVDLNSFSE